jgi:hypothetical protein
MKSKSRIGAYILIGLGIIFLLSNLGWLPPLRSLMAQWWPLILIIGRHSAVVKAQTVDRSFPETKDFSILCPSIPSCFAGAG